MYSIICCSIDSQKADLLRQNIKDTIGDVPFEFIAFDNRVHNYGICRVYNLCAEQAKFKNLCFIHEDVKFLTNNWGNILASKLEEENCGVIGFAGSTCKLQEMTSWNTCNKALRANYVQFMRHRGHRRLVNPSSEDYSRVVTLDGLCMFVPKTVWQQVHFDEGNFTGFHGYDIDFSLTSSTRYANYVCHEVLVEHDSEGSFSQEWLASMDVLHHKWHDRLPLFVHPVTTQNLPQYKRMGNSAFIKFMWQKGCFDRCGIKEAWVHCKLYPFHLNSWVLWIKYIKYRIRYRH